jgi:hypothetical protein
MLKPIITAIREKWKKGQRGPDRSFDPNYRPRVGGPVEPKIFGIGLSRTGTTSLYAALELLGYRSATNRHMRVRGLHEWYQGNFTNDYLDGYDAITDLPIGAMYRELYDRYPGSKFILTRRALEPWMESLRRRTMHYSSEPKAEYDYSEATNIMAYGYSRFNEEAFRRVHTCHESDVQAFFADKPGELLCLNVFEGEGWEELCEFLGKPVPDQEYPWKHAGKRRAKLHAQ